MTDASKRFTPAIVKNSNNSSLNFEKQCAFTFSFYYFICFVNVSREILMQQCRF